MTSFMARLTPAQQRTLRVMLENPNVFLITHGDPTQGYALCEWTTRDVSNEGRLIRDDRVAPSVARALLKAGLLAPADFGYTNGCTTYRPHVRTQISYR